MTRNVAILVFDGVEVLDFAGPYEVFNVTAELNEPSPFRVYTVAETAAPIRTRGSLTIHPDYTISSMPHAQILVVPGGRGTRALLKRDWVLDWLRKQGAWIEHMVSVCTGALVLAKAGMLSGLECTTHHDNLDDLRRLLDDNDSVRDDVRYVDNGRVIIAGGVSAGIDASLHLVRRLLGDEVLARTLSEMEYAWTPDLKPGWPAAVQALIGQAEPAPGP